MNLYIILSFLLVTVDAFFQTQPPYSPPNRSSKININRLHAFDPGQLLYDAQTTASSVVSSSMGTSAASPTTIGLLYGAGLITSFSPCAFSLLPLTVSYISSAASESEDGDTLVPTAAFAAGLAFVFCSAGLSAALLGREVFGSGAENGALLASGGNTFDSRTLLAALSSLVACGMGLQLLRLVEIPLPNFEGMFASITGDVKNEVAVEAMNDVNDMECSGITCNTVVYSTSDSTPVASSVSTSESSGPLFRMFLLGCSSALVASPCATPVLTSVLAYVAQSQNPLAGSVMLFSYTLGYTSPLLVVGAAGGSALVNLAASAGESENDNIVTTLGNWVSPLTAAVLLFYGTSSLLKALFGDPSMMGLGYLL
mmetsp:Transcript_3300/g.6089  ORF Transcript_3300/g.6089 Transcript_3300/m.6089 type:complete len:370 (-) Transcript_3300:51-1160(-)|eukprot:CAMPEP_0113300060 /NCGR_PEP_ID=MMETSP0010_2-20120614/1844_1 /TAXON_ID=216773 ORGANISM="Corethron hystrix, Strain 308" /NCGR_SAMPLE_ID=MMETSP0010_2 /ASSEMBLY_ACC=CAM_ASM_000155 /LENGTH=369 /DNA_ID=CAMNT_0000153415 /DNA_START=17 /DNA_END=1126 /DNA_ORIENTATION=+ /assembly_acc=CAM_ASM_000155